MNLWYILAAAALVGTAVALRRAADSAQLQDGTAIWLPGPEPMAPLDPVNGPDAAWMPTADPLQDTMPDQETTITESAIETLQETAQVIPQLLGLAPAAPDPGTAERNVRAFLDMIAYAEGTAGPNGYRTLFGGGTFDSMADHPRQFFTFTNKAGQQQRTSAAGRYQFLSRTWDSLARKLELPDFGPASQDAAAVELIRQRGALADVQAGRVSAAVAKCAPIWASLPGANYAQPERKLTDLVANFTRAGGTLEA